MATNEPRNTLFDYVATEIINTFDRLKDQLIARRDALLQTLQIMKEDYISKESTRKASIAELERLIQQMIEESVKVNTNFQVQQDAIKVYKRKIQQYQTPTKHPSPFFSCHARAQLQTQMSDLGELQEGVDYSIKTEPVRAVGKRGNADNELEAAGLALDETDQLIFIADCLNSRIQVVSFDGKFMKRFGQDKLKRPHGIAVTEDSVFVSDLNMHALFQFRKKDCKLVRRTGTEGGGEGQLMYPRGICIDYNSNVYVADQSNNRISIFLRDLKFLTCFGKEHLNNPRDVKVTPNSVIVLDRSTLCVHFFSRNGVYLKSCVTKGEDGMMLHPSFFCLDTAGNIIISDYRLHCINILSPSEQLIRTIGKEGHGRGEFCFAQGICISESGTIFVISRSDNFCLQAF